MPLQVVSPTICLAHQAGHQGREPAGSPGKQEQGQAQEAHLLGTIPYLTLFFSSWLVPVCLGCIPMPLCAWSVCSVCLCNAQWGTVEQAWPHEGVLGCSHGMWAPPSAWRQGWRGLGGWVGEAPGGPAMGPVPQPCAGSSAALGARQNIWCHFSTPWRQFSGPQGSIPLVMGSSWVGAPKIWALANAMPAQEACRGLQAVSTLARQGAGGRLAGWEGV